MDTDPSKGFVYLVCDLRGLHNSRRSTLPQNGNRPRVMAMQVKLVTLALAVFVFSSEGRFFYDGLPPLLLSEYPYAVDDAVATVPLVLMAQDRLQLVPVHDVQIAGFSLTQPLVTLQAPDEPEAMPAVQVALQRPLWVSEPEIPITFPSAFTVVHDGICMPIPVGAVIAPVPTGTFISHAHPIAVSVVYAVPTGPLPPQYPLPVPTRLPNVTDVVTVTTRPQKPQRLPEITVTPRPEKPQLITVLDFPSTVQTPPVLVFQPPTDAADSELENRNPPLGVVPAGIVQSAAPTPNLSVFVNSKESPVLQELREQANRFKGSRP
ncbi:uncharacterized protein [Periplaneta americana]|uniref:uncharacterized protein n=1 Tax=Periplaneta americana TaxID=6978 RepID=UPI0037E7E9F5